MAHPIHQSTENSPYGDLTKEVFYRKHRILHHQSFMLNKQNMKIFTQSWRPDSDSDLLRGLVAMVHGYTLESSWVSELTAVAVAKANFFVCALDIQGHGYSDGYTGHIPDIKPIVGDCMQFFDSARADHPKVPAFLYGESLGGAIAILLCLEQKSEWSGLILSGAMCGVSKKMKPVWPLEKLLPMAAFVAPTWRIVITKHPVSMSYREERKRKLVEKSPNFLKYGKPSAATALEFLRVCEYIKKNCHKLEVPMLMVHGGNDTVCDPKSAMLVYESAATEDKTLKIYDGTWHQLIGESNERVELVFGNIISWIGERAGKEIANCNTISVQK